jgi:hypothetical protein
MSRFCLFKKKAACAALCSFGKGGSSAIVWRSEGVKGVVRGISRSEEEKEEMVKEKKRGGKEPK